jgi:hypothetical protein
VREKSKEYTDEQTQTRVDRDGGRVQWRCRFLRLYLFGCLSSFCLLLLPPPHRQTDPSHCAQVNPKDERPPYRRNFHIVQLIFLLIIEELALTSLTREKEARK